MVVSAMSITDTEKGPKRHGGWSKKDSQESE